MDCSPPGSSVHGDSPGENTGVCCHALLQGIFLTQGSNLYLLCLLHHQAGSLPLVSLGGHMKGQDRAFPTSLRPPAPMPHAHMDLSSLPPCFSQPQPFFMAPLRSPACQEFFKETVSFLQIPLAVTCPIQSFFLSFIHSIPHNCLTYGFQTNLSLVHKIFDLIFLGLCI